MRNCQSLQALAVVISSQLPLPLKSIKMSIFNFLTTKKRFTGSIQINENRFFFFSMDTQTVRQALSPNLADINRNMKTKEVTGKVEFCKFYNHNGKIYLF